MRHELHDIIPKGSPCAHCNVCTDSICSVMKKREELLDIATKTFVKKYKIGDIIQAENEPQTFLGTILTGTVKMERITEAGEGQILGILFPTDFVGRAHSEVCSYQAVALEDVEICCAQQDDFKELFTKYPHLESSLFSQTLKMLDKSREWLVVLGKKRAFERVACLIALYYKRLGNRRSFYIHLSREAMADFLGLTFETVSRQLSQLKKAGIIKIEGHNEYTILNSEELLKLAQI